MAEGSCGTRPASVAGEHLRDFSTDTPHSYGPAGRRVVFDRAAFVASTWLRTAVRVWRKWPQLVRFS